MSELEQPKRSQIGPEAFLSAEERKALQRSLSFPEDLPPKFRSFLIDFIAVNIPQISIRSIVGFDRFVYKRGTVFPPDPSDGQMFGYEVESGIIWQFRYDSTIADAFKWVYTGGPPRKATIATAEGTTSSSYTALATAGPSVVVPRAGDYYVSLSFKLTSSGATTGAMSFDVGGTGASDNDALALHCEGGARFANATRVALKTGLTAGTTLTSKYREAGASGFTVTFAQRFISILPLRVS